MSVGRFVLHRARAGLIDGWRAGDGWRARDGWRLAANRLAIPAYIVVLGIFVAFRFLAVAPWKQTLLPMAAPRATFCR